MYRVILILSIAMMTNYVGGQMSFTNFDDTFVSSDIVLGVNTELTVEVIHKGEGPFVSSPVIRGFNDSGDAYWEIDLSEIYGDYDDLRIRDIIVLGNELMFLGGFRACDLVGGFLFKTNFDGDLEYSSLEPFISNSINIDNILKVDNGYLVWDLNFDSEVLLFDFDFNFIRSYDNQIGDIISIEKLNDEIVLAIVESSDYTRVVSGALVFEDDFITMLYDYEIFVDDSLAEILTDGSNGEKYIIDSDINTLYRVIFNGSIFELNTLLDLDSVEVIHLEVIDSIIYLLEEFEEHYTLSKTELVSFSRIVLSQWQKSDELKLSGFRKSIDSIFIHGRRESRKDLGIYGDNKVESISFYASVDTTMELPVQFSSDLGIISSEMVHEVTNSDDYCSQFSGCENEYSYTGIKVLIKNIGDELIDRFEVYTQDYGCFCETCFEPVTSKFVIDSMLIFPDEEVWIDIPNVIVDRQGSTHQLCFWVSAINYIDIDSSNDLFCNNVISGVKSINSEVKKSIFYIKNGKLLINGNNTNSLSNLSIYSISGQYLSSEFSYTFRKGIYILVYYDSLLGKYRTERVVSY